MKITTNMTEKTCKVGDTIDWEHVPPDTMVRTRAYGLQGFVVRHGDGGWWVQVGGDGWCRFDALQAWPWKLRTSTSATIIALGLTGQETAADLQRLAEVFEVMDAVAKQWGEDLAEELAERLHAAGWRPGMTAEDAARLLAEGVC